MDDAYFRYPVGSQEHFAAYEKEFHELGGIGYPFPDDAWASYEVDNYYELAYARYEDPEPREEDSPDGETDWEENREEEERVEPRVEPAPSHSSPDIEMEWF